MAHVYADLVAQYTETVGTGPYELKAAVANRRTFGVVLSNGDTTDIQVSGKDNAGNDAWEVTLATYATTGDQFARTTIRSSSTGSAINWGPGVKTVTMVQAAGSMVARSPDGTLALPYTTYVGGGAGAESLRVIPVASAVNAVQVYGAASGAPAGVGAVGQTNAGIDFYTQGSGQFRFLTAGGTTPQVQIQHTANANRYITLTGSNGGVPSVSTNAGAIYIDSAGGSVHLPQGVEINIHGSGDRYAFIDFHSNGLPEANDYSARIVRNPGSNNILDIINAGTGNIRFLMNTDSGEHLRLNSTVGANRCVTITPSNGGDPIVSTSGGDLALLSATGTVWSSATLCLGGVVNGESLRVLPAASSNRWVVVTGSNGGNPSIGTNAGDLSLAPASGRVSLTGVAVGTTSPSAGGAGALPATPTGYLALGINGVERYVPFY